MSDLRSKFHFQKFVNNSCQNGFHSSGGVRAHEGLKISSVSNFLLKRLLNYLAYGVIREKLKTIGVCVVCSVLKFLEQTAL